MRFQSIMRYTSYLGLLLFVLGLYFAFALHSPIWYSFFVIGGFLAFEGINQKKFSVLKKPKWFAVTWLVFIILAIITELIGQQWLHAWKYPAFDTTMYLIHVILIGYPFVAFFGMHLFVFVKRYLPSKWTWFLVPVVAIIFGYINELPNLSAYEWKYSQLPLGHFLGVPILISILWLLLLIVQFFEKPFIV